MKKQSLLGILLLGTIGISIARETTSPVTTSFFVADTVVENNAALAAGSVEIETPTRINNLFESDAANGTAIPRLNPRAASFVSDYVDTYSKSLNGMKSWALPYFNMMDAIFVKHGLPRELKYLAVIESKLKAGAVSWAGAVGPWQFMRGTAVKLGLRVNKNVDERTHYVKSTNAAARYLKDLYAIYGDWLLVIAAYNAGPGTVQKAIAKSGSRNFWDLQYHLPAETRMHVKKFIGTHYVFEGQGGLTTLTKAETTAHYGPYNYTLNRKITPEEQQAASTQQVAGKYQSVIIAKHIAMDVADFNRYNPEFDKVMARSTPYVMKLPSDKMDVFNSSKYAILQESVQLMLTSTAAATIERKIIRGYSSTFMMAAAFNRHSSYSLQDRHTR